VAQVNTWGQSKRNFYGRDESSDEEDEAGDEDEYQEAIRLQKVRARKL
jgi:hypothetical protein